MTRRILAIDGGGIKGIFPAAFLASVEEEVQAPAGSYFDLIAGTSTGGIIALGLGLGFWARDMLSFYKELGPKIFSGNHLLRLLRWIGLSKYNGKPLRQALVDKFQDLKLGDSKNRLVIPSLSLETGEVYVYKTAHHLRFLKDYKERVVDVAMETAAAPSYFPAHRNSSGIPLVDGGTWANNPTGIAVVEAIGVLGWNPSDLAILSLGCTTPVFDIGIGRHLGMGLLYWADKIACVFASGQSSGSLGIAKLLAGDQNLFRISPVVPSRRFGLDGVKEAESLRGLGFSEARKALPSMRPIFFDEPAESFTPLHQISVRSE